MHHHLQTIGLRTVNHNQLCHKWEIYLILCKDRWGCRHIDHRTKERCIIEIWYFVEKSAFEFEKKQYFANRVILEWHPTSYAQSEKRVLLRRHISKILMILMQHHTHQTWLWTYIILKNKEWGEIVQNMWGYKDILGSVIFLLISHTWWNKLPR